MVFELKFKRILINHCSECIPNPIILSKTSRGFFILAANIKISLKKSDAKINLSS